MYRPGTKKFYKLAAAEPAGSGYTVRLDGRAVRTPAGRNLTVPGKRLAEALAVEWNAQPETLDPAGMSMTALACTAIDRIGTERAAIESALLRHAETDLLCYRAENPHDLASRQYEVWQPLVDWAGETHGIALVVTNGILPVPQPQAALDAASNAIRALDDWDLTALSGIAAASGSLIVALALTAGRIDAAQAFEAAQLDEDYQNEKWGTVEEAKRRRDALRGDIQAAADFLALKRS
ncbi:MAG: ATP12 family protein [Rhodospirillales bacterium]